MITMTLEELKLKEQFGRKVYYRKNGIAAVAKYLNSKWWNPFDWYAVEIASTPPGRFR